MEHWNITLFSITYRHPQRNIMEHYSTLHQTPLKPTKNHCEIVILTRCDVLTFGDRCAILILRATPCGR